MPLFLIIFVGVSVTPCAHSIQYVKLLADGVFQQSIEDL